MSLNTTSFVRITRPTARPFHPALRVALYTHNPTRLRYPHFPSPSPLHRLHVRPISYGPTARFVNGTLRALSVPISVFIVGAGLLAYVDYKLGQAYKTVQGWGSGVLSTAMSVAKSAGNGVLAGVAYASTIKVPQVLKDVVSSSSHKSPKETAWSKFKWW